MEIVYDAQGLDDYLQRAGLEPGGVYGTGPLLIDRFLDDAIEIDVDALYDGSELFLGGVMEHIEEAGIHSGDSACVMPPMTLSDTEIARIRRSTEAIAKGVGVRGLLNIQFALVSDVLYVIEANPRASRTVPFVSKASGVQLAKAAALIMTGETIASLRRSGHLPEADAAVTDPDDPIAVKEAVLPFKRFRTTEGRVVDTILGPEMRSTGAGMGYEGVVKFVMDIMTSYGINACPPLLVGVGVGTSIDVASLLSKKALMRPLGSHNPNERAALTEKLLEEGINKIGLGPQGMSGASSVMGVHIENCARHPSVIAVAEPSQPQWQHQVKHL